jgi:hypothetical protein
MPLNPVLFVPPAVAVGWLGTRSAGHIRHAKGSRADTIFMLAVCWSPLAIWCCAILLSLFGSPS